MCEDDAPLSSSAAPSSLVPGRAGDSGSAAPESREREAAWQRGRARGYRAAEQSLADTLAALPAPVARAAARAFPALAEAVRDYAVFLLDPAGRITYWGQGARHVKWWTRDEVEGGHLRMLYPDGGAEDGTAEDHLAGAAERGEFVGEGHRVRRDGSTFWAHVTLTALRDADGTLLGFAKVTRDLTMRRAADAALVAAAEAERARASAESLSAAKSRFIATVSHEIRTPLNAVLGYTALLHEGLAGPLNEGQQRYVERLGTSARHLLDLVEDVLELSRLEARQDAESPTLVPLADLCADPAGRLGDVVDAALTLVEPSAHERGVTLAGALGEHVAALVYCGDESRVRQVLVNLLSNAVKFAQARGDAPARVRVLGGAALQPAAGLTLAGEGPWLWVRVEDTGPGIPAEALQQIFEPFVQLGRQHNRPMPGAGLGLTISRRLARQMGGDISVESTVGVGSAFVLWLAAAPAASLATGGVEGSSLAEDGPA